MTLSAVFFNRLKLARLLKLSKYDRDQVVAYRSGTEVTVVLNHRIFE